MSNPEHFRKPAKGPSPSAADDIADWDALVVGSLDRATATAEKWRTGLAGFVTIVTSVLLLKGPDSQKIERPWNFLVIGLLVIGAGLLVGGLWHALSASAPRSRSQNYSDIVDRYGTVRAYSIAVANSIYTSLERAKLLVIAALAVFGMGIVAWWLVPQTTEKPKTTVVSVTTPNGGTTCGILVDSGSGDVTIRPDGSPTSTSVPLREVTSVKLVERCGAGK
ncbi:hypothetical protein [Nocardia rhizosphaerihabitans]|uniref:Uncharacterized protein n=1 Tax=Nocardia rhizosphaerihabitans TaxID=1691570 RepID=A0ABQ2L206_9NOCA|nr:hypothetical protein [Nocardia rhizosphaerihabitans]GGN99368.1 hypothetical protein GCM10011610_67240 [Nocardia rhizosphaerihabitans]